MIADDVIEHCLSLKAVSGIHMSSIYSQMSGVNSLCNPYILIKQRTEHRNVLLG